MLSWNFAFWFPFPCNRRCDVPPLASPILSYSVAGSCLFVFRSIRPILLLLASLLQISFSIFWFRCSSSKDPWWCPLLFFCLFPHQERAVTKSWCTRVQRVGLPNCFPLVLLLNWRNCTKLCYRACSRAAERGNGSFFLFLKHRWLWFFFAQISFAAQAW